ncbi:hypothetical protein OIU74_007829 [Salix koriyanagi]|uniref:Uncharacterized protein n=1 Tax=Salix koriyanagi TaxID=2511006 RepID=A0A9Q0U4N2_9ROSI|nr:hypothetical protein OIU74_007829 [Salix koriyanagi]
MSNDLWSVKLIYISVHTGKRICAADASTHRPYR